MHNPSMHSPVVVCPAGKVAITNLCGLHSSENSCCASNQPLCAVPIPVLNNLQGLHVNCSRINPRYASICMSLGPTHKVQHSTHVHAYTAATVTRVECYSKDSHCGSNQSLLKVAIIGNRSHCYNQMSHLHIHCKNPPMRLRCMF